MGNAIKNILFISSVLFSLGLIFLGDTPPSASQLDPAEKTHAVEQAEAKK